LPEHSSIPNERVIAALVRTVADLGYDNTTISAISHRAGIPVHAFRALYPTIEGCMLEAFDHHMHAAYARLISAYQAPTHDSPQARLASALHTALQLCVHREPVADLCVVQIRGVSPAAMTHHEQAMRYLTHLATGLNTDDASPPAIPTFLARAIVAGIWHVIYSHLTVAPASDLPLQLTGLLDWIDLYTNPSAARYGSIYDDLPANSQRHSLPRTATVEPSTTGPDSSHSSARLLDATAALVQAYGYRPLTVRAIAARAGLSPSTFYKHFSDKRAAVLAVYDRWVATALPDVSLPTDPSPDKSTPLPAWAIDLTKSLYDDPAAAHVATIAIFELGPTGHARFQQTLARIERLLRGSGNSGLLSGLALTATAGALWDLLCSGALLGRYPDLLSAQLAMVSLLPFCDPQRTGELMAQHFHR
jgi:AcrR family transcriptional regulator